MKLKKEIEEQQRQDNLPGTRVSENTKYIRDGKTAWIPKRIYCIWNKV